MASVYLRENETTDDFYNRCNNLTHFDCSEEEMLWWMMGSRRLPLDDIVPLSVIFTVIFASGVVGSVCICVVIVRHPVLHTATNYYLFNLAVSDLLLLLFGLPNDLIVYWHQYPYTFGIVFCKLRALISEAATYASVLTISAFSLERYLAICYPLLLYTMSGLKRASRIIILLWVIAISSASPFAYFTAISYREYPPNSGNFSSESAYCALMVSSPLLELSSIAFFFVPAVFIMFLYIKIGLHIKSTQITENNTLSLINGHVHGETRQAKSRKAIIRMLVAVVISFFVCWAPFHIQRLFFIYGYLLDQFHSINQYLFNIAGALYYVTATVNPILYNVMSERYRQAFRETFCCRKVVSRRDSRTCDLTIGRDPTSQITAVFRHRESRESSNREHTIDINDIGNGRVDFVRDPEPIHVEHEDYKTHNTIT